MDEYAAGTDVFLTIPHQNNGTNLTLTNLQYQVMDAYNNVLQDFITAPSFNPTASSTIITILAGLNNTSEKIDIRQVSVRMTTVNGVYNEVIFYQLLGNLTLLTPMTDSFMTYAESLLVRIKTSEALQYYDALPDYLKVVALENAYKSIIKKPFVDPTTLTKSAQSASYAYFNREYDPISYGYGYSGYLNSCQSGIDISVYSPTQFNSLPSDMTLALKKAQLCQANNLVENSPVRDKIRQGIISETIGESSMFFKQGGGLGSKFPGISDDAYEYLKPYLFKNATSSQSIRIGRS